MKPVSSIRNLGTAADAAYAGAGIRSAGDLRALGPDEAYLRLIRSGRRPHFIAYYAMVLGLEGRPWNDCPASEKALLRERFDAICASAKNAGTNGTANEKGRSPMEAALAEIGVVIARNDQPTSSRPEKK